MRRPDLAVQLAPLLEELTRFAQWLTGATYEADEVVQETLTRALRNEHDLVARKSLRAWLFQIARNVHVDLRRAQAGRDRLVVLEGGLDELSALEISTVPPPRIEPADLERALAQLPEGARVAVLLTDVWEFDHAEVAEILDLPLGTVKSRVARARAHLARILSEHDSRGRKRA